MKTCESCGKPTGYWTYWTRGHKFCSQQCLNEVYRLSQNAAVYEE